MGPNSGSPIIYNLFPRLAGPFAQWPAYLQHAAGMGFNWIFINPIQQPGSSGSVYSIKDYYRIDPRYLDSTINLDADAQLTAVVDRAHTLGLRVMLDLVINHTASDSILIQTHPEWYRRDEAGEILHPGAPDTGKTWRDLATIDNDESPDRENLWRYWEDLVVHFISLGIDGFRCDAAYQIPVPLWKRIIRKAREVNPSTEFFAETLGCDFRLVIELGNSGFDYIFNSSKWWDFKAPWLLPQYEENRLEGKPSISFPDSHDTTRIAEDLDGDMRGIKLRYLFAAVFSTGVMMVSGYEYCFRKRLHVIFTRPEDWEPSQCDLTGFIREANALKVRYPVFAQESRMEFVASSNARVFAMRKTDAGERERALVILNTDLVNPQHTRIDNLWELLGRPEEIRDISIENRQEHVPDTYDKELLPGQGVILWAVK